MEVGVKVGIDGEKTSDDGGRVENGRFGMKSFPYGGRYFALYRQSSTVYKS